MLDNTQPESPLASDQLETLLFQYITLYERLESGRELSAQQVSNMALLMTKLKEQIEQFSKLTPGVQETLRSTLHATIQEGSQPILASIEKASHQRLKASADQLDRACLQVQNVIEKQVQSQIFNKWTMFAASVMTGLAVGLIIVRWIMPAPILPLTPEQLNTLSYGYLFRQAWPTLSETDQDHIQKAMDVVKQKHPEESNFSTQ